MRKQGDVLHVGIRGRGVGARMHYPVWASISGVSPKFVPRSRGSNSPIAWDVWIIAVTPQAQMHEFELIPVEARFVLIEKPCGASLAEAVRIAELSVGRNVGVNFQLRFEDTVFAAKQEIIFRKPKQIHLKYKSNSHSEIKRSDRFSPSVVVLPHLIDVLEWSGVDCAGADLTLYWLGEWKYIIVGSGISPWGTVDIAIDVDQENEREVFVLSLDNVVAFDVLKPYRGGGINLLRSFGDGPWRQGYRRLCENVYERGVNEIGRERLATPNSAVLVWKTIEKLYRVPTRIV